MAVTRIEIEHHPRLQRITVTAPDSAVLFRVEAPPGVALLALAYYLTRRAAA